MSPASLPCSGVKRDLSMGRNSLAQLDSSGVPVVEGALRAEIAAGNIEQAFSMFERLLSRRRTPHQTVCTELLELCATKAPWRAMRVLEGMSDVRGLDADDYSRIVRLLIMSRIDADQLRRFDELAVDILIFGDDGMHNYFAHLATLLNLELHEQYAHPGGGSGGGSGGGTSLGAGGEQLEVSLLTHKRMIDAAAKLCKRGSTLTPIFDLLLIDMGGREGAQSVDELRRLAEAPTNLASAESIARADEHLETLGLNASQRAAASACLSRRLTLVQGPPGTGKTKVAVTVIELWVRHLGIRPVLACADSNVAIDNIGVALLASGLNIVRTGRPEAVHQSLHACMPDALGGAACIGEADVVLCTCIGSGADAVGKFAFPAVLIDETAQSTEPSCLVPLTRGCRQLALVGDHKQLRPTVVSDSAASQGLQLSLFERLLKSGVSTHLLDTQYRMHPSLASFPSSEFYGGKLLSGTPPEARPQPRGFSWPSSRVSAALVPSTSPEEGGSSKCNRGEAYAASRVEHTPMSPSPVCHSESTAASSPPPLLLLTSSSLPPHLLLLLTFSLCLALCSRPGSWHRPRH